MQFGKSSPQMCTLEKFLPYTKKFDALTVRCVHYLLSPMEYQIEVYQSSSA